MPAVPGSGCSAPVTAAHAGMREILGRGKLIKSHLVGRQAQKHARVVRIDAGVVADAFDPEFRAEIPFRQLFARRRAIVVDHQPQTVFPTPRAAEGIELMLANHVGGKPIRVRRGGPLGVGQQINFAMGLLERLRDSERLEPSPPGDNLIDRQADRVPE